MDEGWVLQGLIQLTELDPSFTQAALFVSSVLCLFVVALAVSTLLKSRVKDFEPLADEIDLKLSWAMILTGIFMIFCGLFILLTRS